MVQPRFSLPKRQLVESYIPDDSRLRTSNPVGIGEFPQ